MIRLLLLSLLISTASAKPIVFSSIDPISYIIERIGADSIEIQTLIPEGKDPHTFSPSPKQIKKLSQAKLYFVIDAPFEIVIRKKLKKTKEINLGKNISKKASHHHGHLHHHDPHIWLAPKNLKIMARQIADALGEIVPTKKVKINSRLKVFLAEINLVENKISAVLKIHKGSEVLVFHPAFGYFLDSFEIKQHAVEYEGKLPSPKHLARIIKHAKKSNIKIVFTQPQFSSKAAVIIAQGINGKVEVINALEKDILKNFIKMSNAINEALK